MHSLNTRPTSARIPARKRFRIDAPTPSVEASPESLYLRRWAIRQASRYQDLLSTIAAAPKAD